MRRIIYGTAKVETSRCEMVAFRTSKWDINECNYLHEFYISQLVVRPTDRGEK